MEDLESIMIVFVVSSVIALIWGKGIADHHKESKAKQNGKSDVNS
jgi:hypothetical protein